MAMIIQPTNEYQKEFANAIYEILKNKGFSKIGYVQKDLSLENLNLHIRKGDLIILAKDSNQKAMLFELYREILKKKNFPKTVYIDELTLAFKKLIEKESL